jgi:hypothetical protein
MPMPRRMTAEGKRKRNELDVEVTALRGACLMLRLRILDARKKG